MGGVDISIAVEQVVGGGERALVIDAERAHLIEGAPSVAQIPQDRRADVGGLSPSTTLLGRRRAQLRCPRHRRHGTDRVATVEVVSSDPFDQRRDVLVGSSGGLGKVPGAKVITRNNVSEHTVGVTSLIAR